MVFVSGECRQIVRDAVRLYAKRFPERVTPSRSAFTNVIKSFQEIERVDNKIRRSRSPDLTPLDFYLWGKLKQQVYNEIPTTKEDMKESIRRACAAI
ncbi:hypothetical protein WN55_07549 [Dufourea novaeangliae]|uniref:DUF4817 domain-containing protein n=1 Tax=Dufourea novaeangliae TaxID=178035 RepID=A0A154P4D4_DUFNO|nr:hypothetical protein WN55_07549 [Dufourea novaeangliae]